MAENALCKEIALQSVHYPPSVEYSASKATALRQQLSVFTANGCDGVPATSFTSDEKPFIIDTGASITIKNDAQDFTHPLRPVYSAMLKGIASGLEVKGIGTAVDKFNSSGGSSVTISLDNVLFVPACPVCLLCPRHVAESTGIATDGFNSQHDGGFLTIQDKRILIPYYEQTGSPMVTTSAGCAWYQAFVTSAVQHFDTALRVKGN